MKFEEIGKTIDQIEADFEYLDKKFESVIPSELLNSINQLNKENKEFDISLDTGTLLVISNLRDLWTEKEINKIIGSLGYLIPPTDQKDYVICTKKSLYDPLIIVNNEVSDEYDYKLFTKFDGEIFHISIVEMNSS
ncbi:hypothetical protein KHA80_06185 [Anaerobacillus sp. HL2]|nr:hypothetical protein KHA80_06185 [Anaerobacillus sp. HL2]